MKVAVLSLEPTSGKTSLIAALGGLFSRSHARKVCILSTGSALDNIHVVDVKVHDSNLANAHVFSSMVGVAEKNDLTLLNYGTRQGDEEVYIYDIFGSSMSAEDSEELLLECIDKLPADLTLIEIVGDYETDLNKKIIEACDCCIVLFTTSIKSMRAVKDFNVNKEKALGKACAYVCSQYSPEVISEKKMTKFTGLSSLDTFLFPYSPVIQKRSIERSLDRIAYDIIIGSPDVMRFRSKLIEIMQFLFDTPTRKTIRSVDKWYK